MAHHHLSLDCPACGGSQTAVGRVSANDVNSGDWHCFQCLANGTFTIDRTVVEPGSYTPTPSADGQ